MLLDQARRCCSVPARQHDHGGPQRDRHVQPTLHAQHMKQRRNGQKHRVDVQPAPDLRGHVGRQHRGVGVHAALGVAGGARGVGQHTQVLAVRVLRRRGQSLCDRVFEPVQTRGIGPLARCQHNVWHGIGHFVTGWLRWQTF